MWNNPTGSICGKSQTYKSKYLEKLCGLCFFLKNLLPLGDSAAFYPGHFKILVGTS